MKKSLLIALISFATTAVYAQTDTASSGDIQHARTIDTANAAKIYVVRSTGHTASAINLRVVVDDVIYCKIKNNRYAVFWVEPGVHRFNATSWDKSGTPEKFALKMPVEAGKSYYMSMRLKQKLVSTEIFLEEITYNSAAPLLEKYKPDTCD